MTAAPPATEAASLHEIDQQYPCRTCSPTTDMGRPYLTADEPTPSSPSHIARSLVVWIGSGGPDCGVRYSNESPLSPPQTTAMTVPNPKPVETERPAVVHI